MPTYRYKCKNDHFYEEVRLLSEEEQKFDCPECNEPLNRVFTAPPIQFKGTGWAGGSGNVR